MEEKRKRGRPPKHGDYPMSGAERTRQWRENKRARETGERKKRAMQQQEAGWAEVRNARARRKFIEKTLANRDGFVKEFLTVAVDYRHILKLARLAVQEGKFAPETLNIVQTRHDEIRLLMADLERELQALTA